MLSPLLETLEFRSNNAMHQPVVAAIEFLKAHRGDNKRHFSLDEGVPIDGVITGGSREIVVEKEKNGVERINRINYEICVLQSLRERQCCSSATG